MKGVDKGLFRRLFPYIRKNLGLVFVSLLLMIAGDFFSVLHPYLLKTGIDGHITQGDFSGLIGTAILLGAVILGTFLCRLALNFSVGYLGQRFLYSMRMDVFKKVMKLGSEFFDKTSAGAVMTNTTNDVEAIREFISDGIITIAGESLKLIFIVTAMVLINLKLALITFITIPLFVFVTMFFRNNIRKGYRGVRQANSLINSSLVETLLGIREINLFNNKIPSTEKFTRHNRAYLESYLKVLNTFSLFFATFEVISFFGFFLILLFAHYCIGVYVRVGEIFAFFAYLNMFYRPFRQLAEKFNSFQSAMAAAERIFALLDRNISVMDPKAGKKTPSFKRGEIVFKNVTFGYEPDNPVLKDLSFRILPGETAAFVGHTGAGKTTIINLLNRLYDIQNGSVLIDGIDVRDYGIKELRESITTVPQDFVLFNGSVTENITLNRAGIDIKDVRAAAEAVRADKFIKALPQGYDTLLLEDGKSLSTGQKQLLSFARAFVTRSGILIIDEATSNIDSKTEKLIEKALENLLRERTALIIAHRLSTIKHVDRILVMHNGKIAEDGRHEELLKRGGIYSRLYKLQTLGDG